MTRQIRSAVSGLRQRFTVEGSSADIGADMFEALPQEELEVPPEPMGPIAITVRVVAVVLVVVLVLGLLWLLRGLVLNTFLALLFAAGLLPSARRLERRMSRPAAAITVNVVVVGLTIAILLLAARPAVAAIGSFIAAIPDLVEAFATWLQGLIGAEAYNQLVPDDPSTGSPSAAFSTSRSPPSRSSPTSSSS